MLACMPGNGYRTFLHDRKSEVDLDNEHLPSANTLGVWWLAEQDVFTFEENAPNDDMIFTKRNFLKKIATLFDPIGLLSPFTVRAKILLQNMWMASLKRDEEMNESLAQSARYNGLQSYAIRRNCRFQDALKKRNRK